MKKLIMSVAVLVAIAATYAQMSAKAASDNPNKASFAWESTTHDFGKVEKGKPINFEYNFTNSGDIPLIISNVKASCGCTVTDYTTEAIKPGESGMVKATYNASKVGVFSKSVTVIANTNEDPVILVLKGEVVDQLEEGK